jgi:hypothetical protein
VLAARLETSLELAARIKRSRDPGLAAERSLLATLSTTIDANGRTARAGLPSFSCDIWHVGAKAPVGLELDTITVSNTVTIAGRKVAIIGVETDR